MRKIRKCLLATAAFVALGTSVYAADLARPAYAPPPAPPPVPVCTWCGFYIGGDVGGYWASQSATTVPSPSPGFGAPAIGGAGIAGFGNLPTSHGLDRSGFIGGAYTGYNWQWGQFVAGLEADISGLGRHSASSTQTVLATFPATPSAAYNMTVNADNTWLATARARAGFATGPALWYVTGGAAWTKTSSSASASGLIDSAAGIDTLGQFATTSWNDTKTGFVVGGGVEWMFAPNWIVRAEYLYHQFSGSSSTMPLQGVAAGGGNTCVGGGGAAQCNWAVNTSDLRLNVARVGVAYKF